MTVVNISATTFPQTLDWLHSYLLQVGLVLQNTLTWYMSPKVWFWQHAWFYFFSLGGAGTYSEVYRDGLLLSCSKCFFFWRKFCDCLYCYCFIRTKYDCCFCLSSALSKVFHQHPAKTVRMCKKSSWVAYMTPSAMAGIHQLLFYWIYFGFQGYCKCVSLVS